MLAPTGSSSATITDDAIQAKFLAVLPAIEKHAQFRFRSRPASYRDDLIAEVTAYAFVQFQSLLRKGKDPTPFIGRFAKYTVLAVQNGRSVGRSLNRRELYAAAARSPELQVHSLDSRCPVENARWRELVVEKRAFPPDEVGSLRVDFGEWLESLPARSRRLADLLASGEQASVVARTLQISRARVSQLRAELAANWKAFQGEIEPAEKLQAALA